jgi:hypothetical protein
VNPLRNYYIVRKMIKKKKLTGWVPVMPVSLTTLEAEIRKITV